MLDCIIVNTGLSNIKSIANVCRFLNINFETSNYVKSFENTKSIILPGVGAFHEGMQRLKKDELDKKIIDFSLSNKPIFAICLGMQMLMESSEEFGHTEGLKLIDGKVKKFDPQKVQHVPHVGWNKVIPSSYLNTNSYSSFSSDNFIKNNFFYFVHSYRVIPGKNIKKFTYTKYGDENFCSSFEYKNIFATQFHPEKSGFHGINLIKSFFNKINNEN